MTDIYADITDKLTDLTDNLHELQTRNGMATQAEEVVLPTVLNTLHDSIDAWTRLLETLHELHDIEH